MNVSFHKEMLRAARNDARALEHAGAQMMVCGVLGPNSNTHERNEFLHLPFANKRAAAVASVICSLP